MVDTNILIYAISRDCPKCKNARDLLIDKIQQIIISSQVINEFISVTLKKQILPLEECFKYAEAFMNNLIFSLISKNEIRLAMDIMKKYKFSFWDSLIVASVLENNCTILYTEDMQDGQAVENKLKIINPFRSLPKRL